MLSYNAVRCLMRQAAAAAGRPVAELSFCDCLQEIIDATPLLSRPRARRVQAGQDYLLTRLAYCEIDRPRRPRSNPRVVKVKLSKFRRKVGAMRGVTYDFERDLEIGPAAGSAAAGALLRFPSKAPAQPHRVPPLARVGAAPGGQAVPVEVRKRAA